MTSELSFLNGQLLPLAEAHISVLDRGFLFGDGVYEVLACFGGRPFRLRQHQERLQNSLAAIRIDAAAAVEALWAALPDLLASGTPGADCSLYIQVTRGVAPRDHAFPKPAVPPTVFAMLMPLQVAEPKPARAITRADIRWDRCDIKSVSLLANCLLRQEAVDAGVAETLLLRDGHLSEGSVTSAFIVKDGVVYTPPLSADVLPGVTRDLVIELLQDTPHAVVGAPVTEAALRAADEIWVTSSTRDIVPIVELDGVAVGTGQAGPVWALALARYQAFRRAESLRRV